MSHWLTSRRSAHWIISLAGRSPLRSLLTVTASLASQHSSEHNTHSALTPLACKRGITSYTFKISALLNLAVESGLKSKDVLIAVWVWEQSSAPGTSSKQAAPARLHDCYRAPARLVNERWRSLGFSLGTSIPSRASTWVSLSH